MINKLNGFQKKQQKESIMIRSTERKKNLGEVFTPPKLVNEMLNRIPKNELLDPSKTVGDITGCGNGNFLIEVLKRRMKAGVSHKDSLKTIYGVDIMQDNIDECKERLSLGSKSKKIWEILNNNIICADALDKKHPGWDKVGYMWSILNAENMKKLSNSERFAIDAFSEGKHPVFMTFILEKKQCNILKEIIDVDKKYPKKVSIALLCIESLIKYVPSHWIKEKQDELIPQINEYVYILYNKKKRSHK